MAIPWAALAMLAATGASAYQQHRQAENADKSGAGTITPTNPAMGVLEQLFGTQFVSTPSGSRFLPTGTDPLFDVNRFAQSLRGLMYGSHLQPNMFEQIASGLSGDVRRAYQEASQQFRESVLPSAEEIALTGLRTDLSPIIRQAERQFREYDLPEIAERVSPTYSGFADLASRRAADIRTTLGAEQVTADEAAAARRLSGTSALAELAAASTALPINVAGDLFSLGNMYRSTLDIPYQRPLDVFSQLAGLGQGQTLIQRGYNPQPAAAQMVGSLGTLTSALTPIFTGSGQNAGTPPYNPAAGGGALIDPSIWSGMLGTGTQFSPAPFRIPGSVGVIGTQPYTFLG